MEEQQQSSNSNKPSTSGTHVDIGTEEERHVCEILLNLSYLIHVSDTRFKLPVWGARGKRSAIDLTPSPPRHRTPEKKSKVAGGGSSPATPLSFSPSESEEKTQPQSRKILPKKKTKEELEEDLKDAIQRRESLTGEVEKVKACYNLAKTENLELKRRKQELELCQKDELSKSRNIAMGLSLAPPSSSPTQLENHQAFHEQTQFLSLLQQQQIIMPHYPFQNFPYPCMQTPPLFSSPSSQPSNVISHRNLPDLNVSAEETAFDMEYSQPLDQYTLSFRDSNNKVRAAAEARKRRKNIRKEMKSSLNPIRSYKC